MLGSWAWVDFSMFELGCEGWEGWVGVATGEYGTSSGIGGILLVGV